MAEFNDAAETWALLTELERKMLAVLGRHQGNTMVPRMLGRELDVTWQRAARIAGQLRKLGLVRVKSLPKQTSYELSGQGRAYLEAGRSA
jgi:DNA-binding MarR family transcriptional regulator